LLSGSTAEPAETLVRRPAHLRPTPPSPSPSNEAHRILTRLGARDRLSAGESTFAIEMKETSAILAQVDANSLAVIDELGRGTSPKEGG